MAGGILVVLGLRANADAGTGLPSAKELVGDFVGTGMHGGCIYIRGEIDPRLLGKEVKMSPLDKTDRESLRAHIADFCTLFSLDIEKVLDHPFVKLYPYTHRPYGRIYAY